MVNQNIFRAFIINSIILVFISTLLAGCVPMESDTIHHLKVQVRNLNKETAEISQNNANLNKKLQEMQINLANQGVKISGLDAKISDIYGGNEVESHNLELLQKRFEEYRLTVNKELAKLLKLAKIQPVLHGGAGNGMPANTKENPNSTGNSFKKGMSLYNSKDYAGAVESFDKFLSNHPGSSRIADVLFYKASANFYLKNYPVSILELHRFSQIYPDNPNVPMAIYLQGAGFLKVSDPSDASILFRKVISKYPGTKAAALSKRELERLSK